MLLHELLHILNLVIDRHGQNVDAALGIVIELLL